MQLKLHTGETIVLDSSPFAKGGEGSIYRVTTPKYNEYCVKLFHQGKIDSRLEKLKYMVNHKPETTINDLYRICWPSYLVLREGVYCGFMMPLSFANSYQLYDIYLDDENSIYDRRKKEGMTNRYKVLYNIANALRNIHAKEYVLVDFKPQNILISSSGQISLIDLDSLQISSAKNVIYPATALTIDYAYPKELSKFNKQQISSFWDVYSFAIVAYQILLGIHPFTASTNKKNSTGNDIVGREELMCNNLFPFGSRQKDIFAIPPPQYYFYKLPSSIRDLFIRTFDLSIAVPTIDLWLQAIYTSVYSNDITPNPFRESPKPPITIITDQQLDSSKNKIALEWVSFSCQSVTINGSKVANTSNGVFSIPASGGIIIESVNGAISRKEFLSCAIQSLYCINCGHKFIFPEDNYCTCCGTKRI